MWGLSKTRVDGSRASGSKIGNADRLLWRRLRSLRELGFSFQRRTQVLAYELDFVEPGTRLVVALDGAALEDRESARDKALRDEGYRVLHFRNEDIHSDINAVTDIVVMELLKPKAKRRTPESAAGAGR